MTDRDPSRARPWDVEELEAMDARRLHTGHVVRTIPDEAAQRASIWDQVTDPDTRDLMLALEARGFEMHSIDGVTAWFYTRGPRRTLVALTVSWTDPLKVVYVLADAMSMTARQAAAWLRRNR